MLGTASGCRFWPQGDRACMRPAGININVSHTNGSGTNLSGRNIRNDLDLQTDQQVFLSAFTQDTVQDRVGIRVTGNKNLLFIIQVFWLSLIRFSFAFAHIQEKSTCKSKCSKISIESYKHVTKENKMKPLENYFPQRYLTVLGCS